MVIRWVNTERSFSRKESDFLCLEGCSLCVAFASGLHGRVIFLYLKLGWALVEYPNTISLKMVHDAIFHHLYIFIFSNDSIQLVGHKPVYSYWQSKAHINGEGWARKGIHHI